VVQENIFANVTHDTVSLEFQRSDGTLITQVIDFRNVSTTTTVCVTRTLFYLPDYDTSPPRRNLHWGLLFLTAASARIALFIYSTRKFAAISRIKIVYGKRKRFLSLSRAHTFFSMDRLLNFSIVLQRDLPVLGFDSSYFFLQRGSIGDFALSIPNTHLPVYFETKFVFDQGALVTR
jgi:hypothetical protein